MSFNLVNILDIYYNQLLQSNVKMYIDIAIEKILLEMIVGINSKTIFINW